MEKKTEIPGIYKVSEGVLINKDNEALEAYRKRRDRERRLDYLQNELSELKESTEEIRALLKQFIDTRMVS